MCAPARKRIQYAGGVDMCCDMRVLHKCIVYAGVCRCIYRNVCLHVCVYICVSVYMFVRECVCVCVCVCVYVYVCV